MAKAASSPLSSAAPASDVEMEDKDSSAQQQNGSTRKPREATKKRPAVDAGSDSSDDEEATAISRAKAKNSAVSNSSKAGQLYCHQDHTGHDAAKEVLLRCTGSKPVSTKPGAPHKACILMYCEKCLKKHYEEDARKIIAQGEQDEWKCPSCRNICSCSSAIAAGEAPPPKRAPPGQGKSIQYSRAEGAKGKKRRVKNAVHRGDSDSSLSSLDSDEERRGGGLPNRNAPRIKHPATTNVKRASPPPRPPKTVEPPKTFPLAGVSPTPSTSSILARLHLRAFVLRFLPLMPSLQGSSMKVTQVLTYLSDDLLWMWSRRDAEYAQRILLRGLLELIEKEDEADIFAERQSRRSMVDLVDNQMKRAMTSSNREEVVKPWLTLREIVEAEEVWNGGWGDRVTEWELEREEFEGPESELRGRKGEPGPDEKLALLCALIELTYNAECVRQNLIEGVETEKQTMVALNKKKFKQRHDWNETKQTILAKKPPKPTAPSKGTTLVKLAEVWRSEVQEIDEEVAEAEKESQKETFEIQRYIYLAQSSNRIRFASSGKDAKGNTYYLLSPCNHSSFPSNSTLGINDDYPLSWSILIHGTPFDLSPVDTSTNNKSKTKKLTNGNGNGATEDPSAEDKKPVAAIGSVEEREVSRAKNGDAWFLVDPEKEGDLMIEWIEYAAKWVSYERKKAAYERQKEGKPELAVIEDPKEDPSELLNQLRVYVEYVKAARELAKVEAKNKGKGRAAAMKDKTYTVESDEDELDDDEDELDSD
ncbi:hypothetical protein BCR35DRAFT_331093 [Leucosporidium creatinivorum]|uniref:Zinc-finger domain-containing protein n=1 Tax=Leucosporidium creatinivorum TaxID=106004 RepID=A0A1Y2FLS0_9BASI|nr:hypothetical protein BCR35DRAFT_331093 [Leucosporidium creatinivorum]